MKPPYSITPVIFQLVSQIAEKIGEINASHLQRPPAAFRKTNRIKTIHSSLELEGNTLSLEQVTAVLDNKKVLAPKKDIQEVQNAIAVYNLLTKFDSLSLTSFLKAHKILMANLIPSAGKLRSGSAGIAKGSRIMHLAPAGKMVKPLMNDLFNFLKKDNELLLIKSCVFHYELEFIHPFADGNGRMGRLWQTVLLMKQYPVFEFLPLETIIKNRQAGYYNALAKSDQAGNSTVFIEFMLRVMNQALEELLTVQTKKLRGTDRIELFKTTFTGKSFTRQEYMRAFREISPATASRDLRDAVKAKVLKKKGDKRMTVYVVF